MEFSEFACYSNRMKQNFFSRCLGFSLAFILGVFGAQKQAFAESTPIDNLYHYKLSNGLELFVAENHNVPLVYIETAVRCGAYTQGPETAGLFHLYEHMMFKGNSLYKNAARVTSALNDMGVTNWNGSTDLECVNYFFTIPSAQLRKGLEFWSAAIRSPLMDKKELENEKKVVLSEIAANYSSPERISRFYHSKKLFADSPWKLDTSGSSSVVQNATVKTLKNIQKTFYVPNNSAVFVGGDVNPEEVYKMVQEIYGSWKKAKNPFDKVSFRHSKEPFEKPVFAVMPFEKISKEIAEIEVSYRGPDIAFDREDSYPADIFVDSLSNPGGLFKRSIMKDGYIGVPSVDYVSAGFRSRKSCGVFSFVVNVTMPEAELAERTKYFAQQLPSIVEEAAASLRKEEILRTVNRLEDSNIYTNETASGILSTMRFWWTCADSEYRYSYAQKMAAVSEENVVDFVKKYIYRKNPLVVVYVNPEIFEESKEDFIQAGFEIVSAENAFWFK